MYIVYLHNVFQMSNEMWREGKLNLRKIDCASHDSKGVYCLQYDDEKIVSGLRDNTIKVRKYHQG